MSQLPTTRREFLHHSGAGIGLLAFSSFAPAFLVNSARGAAPAPERDRSILVLVQLAGGNDGLNTVVPYTDDNYYRLRPNLGLKHLDLLPISDHLALHPACGELHDLFHDGRLSVVQNVGYPNPNRSHFRSSEIWETATDAEEYSDTGWLGRYLDNSCDGTGETDQPAALHVSAETPQAFNAERVHSVFGMRPDGGGNRRGNRNRRMDPLELMAAFADPDGARYSNQNFLQQTTMNALVTERKVGEVIGAYRPEARYPTNGFARSLQNVAAMIAAGFSTRVYFVSLGGFDTHANQANAHQNLLRTLSQGLSAFQSDLTAHGLQDQVLTATFSEFGRRPAENQSGGTDHGTAAPLFVMGAGLKNPLVGTSPNLDLPEQQADLDHTTDFRSVYATLLDRWLEADADTVLGQKFEQLPFI